MAERLTSPRSPRVKWVRRLVKHARARREEGAWVLEGPHLVREAVRSGICIKLWIFAESWERGAGEAEVRRLAASGSGERVVVADSCFEELADTRTPQGVLCVAEAPRWTLEHIAARPGPVLALDGVQDPGNLGTIARTAEAAECGGMLLGRESVDPGNPKALRASAGSLLRLPAVGVADLTVAARSCDRPLVATSGRHGVPFDQVDLSGPFLLLVGQEGRGLSDGLLALADLRLTVPMAGQVESLNAATAAAVILFEAARQRRARKGG